MMSGKRLRGLLLVGFVLAALWSVGRVLAHANLLRAQPGPNAVLEFSPPEIRLWFSEPLEAQFSKIILRDAGGNILNTPPSVVDPTDATQMVLVPGELPDGLYTVAWRALSSADGHPTLGSYPIVIGDAALAGAITGSTGAIPLDGALIRFANLVSLALGVGGIGFLVFVWWPSAPSPRIQGRLTWLIWTGWGAMGVTGFLLILMQYALAVGSPILMDINGDSLNRLIADTRFGQLWLARMALWVGMGGALWFARSDRWFYAVGLVIGGAILATNSLFSHANAAYDLTASVAADWLHLAAMALWIGGLVSFIAVIGLVRGTIQPASSALGTLVARFSNFARVAVAILFITGAYSSWLQVGSFEALLTTTYGQALLIKLLLIVPVIWLAFINLVFTQQGLAAGQEVWSGRLRGLVGAEIALTLGVLAAVGAMTSTTPARSEAAFRAASAAVPAPEPIRGVQTANDLLIQLDIMPGVVGENTFTLKLVDTAGSPVNDASLIRMRFESQTQNLGESELRPTLTAEGVYSVTGANLSVAGGWRIRVTIQRPDQFDTVVDFTPEVQAAPPPVEAPPPAEPGSALEGRTAVLLAAGVAALAVGGYFLGENRQQLLRASTLLAAGLVGIGVMFLVSGVG
jgi:copper transport protein